MATYKQSLKAAVKAALYGPENKSLSFHGHGLTIKKLSLTWTGTQVVARGQISHRLNLRPDDQVHYSFVVNRATGAVVSPPMMDVDGSPLADIAGFIGGLVVGIVFTPAAGAVAGPAIDLIIDRAEGITASGWEGNCSAVIGVIAASLGAAVATGEIKPPAHASGGGGGGGGRAHPPVHER